MLAPLEHGSQLPPAGDAEVERGPDALRAERDAVPGRVADEEGAVLRPGADAVRDPVALVAPGLGADLAGERVRRLLDVVGGIVGPDADPQLVARRERPAVARADDPAIDPQLEVGPRAGRMDLEPARQGRVGRLDR